MFTEDGEITFTLLEFTLLPPRSLFGSYRGSMISKILEENR
jgi:hypothetical protein